MIPEAEATGRCEVRADSYVFTCRHDERGRATGVTYFDLQTGANISRRRARWCCAPTARRRRGCCSIPRAARFPHGLANSSGLVGKYLMFNYQRPGVRRVFEHALNEYKSVQVTRIVHDFYDSDPKRGFYGGGGIDARIGPQPIIWAHARRRRRAALGQRSSRRAWRNSRASCIGRGRTARRCRSRRNSVSLDPELKDAWGIPAIRVTYNDHPDDLANGALPAGSRRRDPRSGRRAARRTRRRSAEQTLLGAPARHLPHGQRPGDIR